MSNSLNKAMILGRLGATPELKRLDNGSCVLNLSMATSFRKRNADTGEWEEETDWHRVAIWGKKAEGVAKHLKKGMQIYVEGRMKTNKWEDQDGVTRYSTSVQCDKLLFTGDRKENHGDQEEHSDQDYDY